MRFSPPTMTMDNKLRELIHRKFDVLSVNEFYTSQTCCKCNGKLEAIKDSHNKPIYRLLYCPNCSATKKQGIVFVNRDKNAAMNILNLTHCWLHNQRRPLEFQNPASQLICKKPTRVK